MRRRRKKQTTEAEVKVEVEGKKRWRKQAETPPTTPAKGRKRASGKLQAQVKGEIMPRTLQTLQNIL